MTKRKTKILIVQILLFFTAILLIFFTYYNNENSDQVDKQKIEKERMLNSLTLPISFYDLLIDNDFMKQSNFKYLDDAMRLYFTFNEITDDPNSEPNPSQTSAITVSAMKSELNAFIDDLTFFEKKIGRAHV